MRAVFIVVVACLLVWVAAADENLLGDAKGSPGPPPGKGNQCHNKIDDDGDGLFDMDDPGCQVKKSKDETNCGDGVCEGGETFSSCMVDCVSALCGNGVLDPGEECDGILTNSCADVGFSDGNLSCSQYCTFDTAECCADVCVPGTMRCSGGGIQICQDAGSGVCSGWVTAEQCGLGQYCEPSSFTCEQSPELCDNNVDDDADGYTDEQDSDCALQLSFSPNPSVRDATVSASISGAGSLYSGTYYLCDYQGCSNGYCAGQLVASGYQRMSFSAPSTIGTFSYHVCFGENSREEFLDTIAVCGDGYVDGDEQCDSNNLNGATCVDRGYDGGQLGCTASCSFNVNNCYIAGCTDPNAHNYDPAATVDDGSCQTCNDGIQNGDETAVDCGGATCGACPFCGDGVVNQNSEECDGSDLDGQTCASSGYSDGTPSCSGTCKLDVASCCDDVCTPGTQRCNNGFVQTCQDPGAGVCAGWVNSQQCGAGQYCDENTNSCRSSPEDCDNNLDDDADGFIDEQDSECTLSLDLAPNPSERGASISATIQGTGTLSSGTYRVCDYLGCSAGLCAGSQVASVQGGATSRTTSFPAPNTLGSFSYHVCSGQNSASDILQTINVCGDGYVDGSETCDGNNLDGLTCADVGFSDGTLSCASNCQLNTNNCYITGCTDPNAHNYNPAASVDDGSCQTCNDGVKNGDETGVDCGGSCTECPFCGDGTVNTPSEQCDGSDLQGANCISLGFDAGSLSCTNSCGYDTSSCCNDECQVGAVRCSGNLAQVCSGASACNSWVTQDTCTIGEVCTAGACVPVLEKCDNNLDDDGDGRVDEQDTDCPITLTFTPNPSKRSSQVLAAITGQGSLYAGTYRLCTGGCNNGQCVGSQIASLYASGAQATMSFTAPSSLGTFSYYACFGGNQDVASLQTTAQCNDGYLDAGEECDGNNLNGQSCGSQGFSGGSLSCTSSCTFDTASCYIAGCTDPNAHNYNPAASVDDGSCQTCNDGQQNGDETGVDCGGAICTACPACGDGKIDPGEECDGTNLGGASCSSLGYEAGSLTCTTNCQWNTNSCYTLGCTDPNAHNYDPAATVDDGSCQTCNDGRRNGDETGVDCGGQLCQACPFCGDGNIDAGEECDGANLGGESCGSQGFDGGALGCSNCQLNTNNCYFAGCTDPAAHNYDPQATVDDGSCQTCNDGVKNGDETGVDCGGARCAACEVCGDGIIQSGEECDGSNLGGATCATQGFSDGSISCTTQCTLNTNQCCNNACVPGNKRCNGAYVQTCQDPGPGQCAGWVNTQQCGAGQYCDTNTFTCAVTVENCDNNIDDDADGFIDERDSDCALQLALNPSTTTRGQPVTATITGTGTLVSSTYRLCDYLGCSSAFCAGSQLGTASGGGTSATINFNAPLVVGTRNYYVCAGQNSGTDSLQVYSECGDGYVDAGEQCDSNNLAGASCSSLGYNDGSLSCTASCRFNTNQCCQDACSVGSTRCGGGGVETCQDPGAGSCSFWYLTETCSVNEYCDGQTCRLNAENCDNNNDDDGDGWIDEQDPDCPLALNIYPNPVMRSTSVAGTMSGTGSLYGGTYRLCDSYGCSPTGACVYQQLGTAFGGATTATVNFLSPSSIGFSTYYACFGGNSGSGTLQTVALCGDGYVDAGEQCDSYNLAGQTCVSQGYGGGTLSCTTACTFNTASCYIAGCTDPNAHNYNPAASVDDGNCQTCNDGQQNGDETGVDCGGVLCQSCTAYGCTNVSAHNYDPTAIVDDGSCWTCDDLIINGDETGLDCGGSLCGACGVCGDGIVNNPFEECDGNDFSRYSANGNFGQQTCKLWRYDGGTVSCKPNCRLDLTACCNNECTAGWDSCSNGDPELCQYVGACTQWVEQDLCTMSERCNPAENICEPLSVGMENCDNNVDDDGDGWIDEQDYDCKMRLEFAQNPIRPGAQTTATITGRGNLYPMTYRLCDTSCSGGFCSGTEYGSVYGSGPSATIQFTTPETDFHYMVVCGVGQGHVFAGAELEVKDICGDGVIGALEQCEGTNLNGRTCQNSGYDYGQIFCGSDCYASYQCFREGCTNPEAHNYYGSANVEDGSCETCTDGIKNGDESGVDCGGVRCPKCGVCKDTCESLGYNCGTEVICGQAVNCGTCGQGEYCGILNVCYPEVMCGDNVCDGGETEETCFQDCGCIPEGIFVDGSRFSMYPCRLETTFVDGMGDMLFDAVIRQEGPQEFWYYYFDDSNPDWPAGSIEMTEGYSPGGNTPVTLYLRDQGLHYLGRPTNYAGYVNAYTEYGTTGEYRPSIYMNVTVLPHPNDRGFCGDTFCSVTESRQSCPGDCFCYTGAYLNNSLYRFTNCNIEVVVTEGDGLYPFYMVLEQTFGQQYYNFQQFDVSGVPQGAISTNSGGVAGGTATIEKYLNSDYFTTDGVNPSYYDAIIHTKIYHEYGGPEVNIDFLLDITVLPR